MVDSVVRLSGRATTVDQSLNDSGFKFVDEVVASLRGGGE